MKAYDHDALVYDGEVYCNECAPDEATEDDTSPIFADSEWNYTPKCAKCGAEHDYMNIVNDNPSSQTGGDDEAGSFPIEWHKMEALMQHLGLSTEDADLPEYDGTEFTYGRETYLVLTDDEADERAREYIKDTLWAFNYSFLASYIPALNTSNARQNDRIKAAWTKMTGELCEDATPIIAAMLGDGIDRFMDEAIASDGRAHFMNTYDDREAEVIVTDPDGESHTLYVYRVA